MLAIATTSLLPSRRRRAHKSCKLAKASLPGEGHDEGECNLAVILPISGRMSWSNIAGIRCTGEAHGSFRASGARQASLCTWNWRPAS